LTFRDHCVQLQVPNYMIFSLALRLIVCRHIWKLGSMFKGKPMELYRSRRGHP
jgi:hypothetical protein